MSISELITWMDTLPASAVIVGFVVLFVVLGWALSKRKDIAELWNSWYQIRKRKDELLNMILEDHKRLEQFEENRINDRQQSFEIQRQLIDANTQLTNKIESLTLMVQENQKRAEERFALNEEKVMKRNRAELKDKIMRSYRLHHKTQSITAIELEVLEGLIEEYYAVNGNSFVKHNVQPEMYTWTVVDEFE